MASFADLARQPGAPLDRLALALAAEFRAVDEDTALGRLDELAHELGEARGEAPDEQAEALRATLGERHGFTGDRDDYDDPRNSMLDLVLERRRGLPILLSIVYVEVARRAGVALAGVGLPGHFVAAHFGAEPPLLLDPFGGGQLIATEVPRALIQPWSPQETALRMLNNLRASYGARGDLAREIRAAELRLALPLDDEARAGLTLELRALRARLN